MAARPPADITVAPLSRALLEGVDDPAEGPRRRVDLAVLPCFEDERPLQGLAGLLDWRMSGALSALLRDGFWSGAAGEAVLLPGRRTLPMERLVLLGLGPSSRFDRARAEATAEHLVAVVERLAPRDVLVAMPGRVPERAVVEAVFDGLTRALRRSSAGSADAVAQPAVRAVGDDSAAVEPPPEASDPLARAADEGVVPLEAVGEAARGEARAETRAETRGEGPAGDRPGPVAVPAVGSEASVRAAEGSVRSMAPGAAAGAVGARKWWVVADPRHEARLRRLLEGPPRAAERGA